MKPQKQQLWAVPLLVIIAGSVMYLGSRLRGASSLAASPSSIEDARLPDGHYRYTNRLAGEKSPYLLQHAHNPVDWYPWGAEAFARAKKENKPIFLSIGYSTCHWCHVMEHESFEDPEVARLMNDSFVAIKVDREERPDIDNVYMTVSQMLSGSGGWPLTILMTPDKKPFYAGTYIPREGRFGQPGMLELLPQVAKAWSTQHDKIADSANKITSALQQASSGSAGGDLGASTLSAAYRQLESTFDAQNGGFGTSPKFPTPHQLLFLLRYWKRSGDAHALAMVEKTLRAMRQGGIYDQVGFGFHRYSTDARWLVPHFEKMLYDQALLAMAYTEAFQATGKAEYRQTAREILTYVLRDMTSPEGGFYSAEDADSQGQEGKFYLWTQSEIRQVLGAGAGPFIKAYGVEDGGNFADEASGQQGNSNILHRTAAPSPAAAPSLEAARQKLFAAREKRVHPRKDDKILTDWNGLMIAALAKAGRAFGEPRYTQAAQRAADFILQKARKNDRLLHRYREGEAAITAHLDDYAFLCWGLLELYEADFDARRLQSALDLNRSMLAHFWDGQKGGLYLTADDSEELLTRSKEVYDGAVPSGNSVAMWNLLRLSRMTGQADLEARAARLERAFSAGVAQQPAAHTQFLVALDFAIGPSYEVVIAGKPQAPDARAMLRALNTRFLPNKVVLLRPTGQAAPPITSLAAFTRYQTGLKNKATAYVCLKGACRLPTTDINQMLSLLNARQNIKPSTSKAP